MGRAIGSIRREPLDHVVITGEAHLRRLHCDCAEYYNTWPTHLGLEKDTPTPRLVQHHGEITSVSKVGGLHHAYVRI